MPMVLGVIAPCIHRATLCNSCTTCSIALLNVVLAIVTLVVAYVVCVEGTKVKHVSP